LSFALMSATMPEAILAAAAAEPELRLIFHGQDGTSTFRLSDFVDGARRCATSYRALGVQPGDVVAVQVPSSVEGAMAQAAALLAGAVLVPIVHIYGPHELGFILRESRARVLVTPSRWGKRDYLADLRRIGPSPDLAATVVIGTTPSVGHSRWSDLLEAAPIADVPGVAPDDLCLLVYTSGTTGEPKGVQHTHRTILAELRTRLTAHAPNSVVLAAFPSGHVAGTLGVMRMLVQGTPHVVMDTWDATTAARLIEEHRITSTGGAPLFLATLLDMAEGAEHDLSSLREYGVGGASVPPAVIERADHHGLAAFRAYGSSEHPSISGGSAHDPLQKRMHTDGRLLDGVEVRIVDDELLDLPTGEAGEILSRGPELFVGYRDRSLNDTAFVAGGWFRTGDVGRLDAEGYLTITDRKKDIIIRGGENISSKEVEDVLAEHPAVAEVAVIGVPDERYGERVLAFVVLRIGSSLTLEDVGVHFSAAGVARQKTPERVQFVDALPRTAAGKAKKDELRRLAEPARGTTAEPA
jgi:cyclohexanecarboxylate-CoA ligase